MLLIHPPHCKNCEPPAGIACLAGALQAHKLHCTVCDMNSEGMEFLFHSVINPQDTWTRRALLHKEKNLSALQTPALYCSPAAYRKAVFDCNRLLATAGAAHGVTITLANYHDEKHQALNSSDLLSAAGQFEENIFFRYFSVRLPELLSDLPDQYVGFSLNYLSQAACTFAMIGFLKRYFPKISIIVGGGLATSWQRSSLWQNPFTGLVDHWVAGRGEEALLAILESPDQPPCSEYTPDYRGLAENHYLAPGPIIPFPASRGCYWRKCSFCPETSEMNPFSQLQPRQTLDILHKTTDLHQPVLIHFLDNALTPAFLQSLIDDPPGIPWYGFARLHHDLTNTDYCRSLRKAGCVMLKIGLESGSQRTLDALNKGIRVEDAIQSLKSLHTAGIATYVYLLFGTPAEDFTSAQATFEFTRHHHECITFLNLAIFNLPIDSPDATNLVTSQFYQGDLALYYDFEHPQGWHRGQVRHFLDTTFKKNSLIKQILQRDPPFFTSNHAPFFVS